MRAAGTVVIGPIDAHRAARRAIFAIGDSGLHGLFTERPVMVVAVEFVRLGVVRDDEIGPTVTVEIDDAHPERFAGRVPESGFRGYVFKTSAAQVMKQPARRSLI